MEKEEIVKNCMRIKEAYEKGLLGNTTMPEDTHPIFKTRELQLSYFTLPMSLNYQRNSYKLWEAALKTYDDPLTKNCFNIEYVSTNTTEELRRILLKYKLALQPNKHIDTWRRISKTIYGKFGSFESLFKTTNYDFLDLRNTIQKELKKDFPYISGPKIFNYWSYIIQEYGDIKLKNSEYIEIAPDTHVIQASVKLGLISKEESKKISRENLSSKWRDILKETDILPIQMHSPLWFWSRSGFRY